MPEITIDSSVEAELEKTGSVYSTVRDATSGTVNAANLQLGQSYYELTYYIWRLALIFDTSEIPNNSKINSATLRLFVEVDHSDTDFDIVIQNGQPTYPHNPVEAGDYNRAHYSGDGGSLNTSGISGMAYNDIALNEDGKGWVNCGGETKLMLRSGEDIGGSAPSGNEYVNVSQLHKLVIDYTPPAGPFIVGGGSPVWNRELFLLGAPELVHEGNSYLVAKILAEKYGWSFLKGLVEFIYMDKGYLKGSISLWGIKEVYLRGIVDAVRSHQGYLFGNIDPLWAGAGFLKGTVTAVPYIAKPTVGSWFLRISSVMKEVA